MCTISSLAPNRKNVVKAPGNFGFEPDMVIVIDIFGPKNGRGVFLGLDVGGADDGNAVMSQVAAYLIQKFRSLPHRVGAR